MTRGFIVTERIERPVEVVWDRLIDWEQAWQWMEGVEGIRIASTGPMRPGAKLAFWARGRERHSTVVAWEPHQRVALESRQGGVTAVYDYGCRERHGATEVTLDARCAADGAVWRLVHPLVAYLMKRTDGGQLRKLKQVVETRCL